MNTTTVTATTPAHPVADKVALIAGVTGQYGAYLSEPLLGKIQRVCAAIGV